MNKISTLAAAVLVAFGAFAGQELPTGGEVGDPRQAG